MNDYRKKRKSSTSLWVAIGAIILIVLLIVWLTMADFWHDTDVAAFLTPAGFSQALSFLTL
ncbi:MAG: hypothetical protein K2M85_01480 [Paramuribaculum sp.]|nr:hypothetical protein [Bacteroides sp.]MBD5375430.1 hypothetical protein [Bacteroides sp.]MBD5375739.1 hypothetical protein [Bacteroides sp.]MDE7459739.1 hypothetical protein [Paramuribaculum sp.]